MKKSTRKKWTKRYICITGTLVAVLAVLLIMKKPEYFITQYNDIADSQAMFYTIESTKNKLIVVDGGTTPNAEYVREIITGLGGKVDAWILTHPHPDHIGAFNAIWQDPQEIKIKEVYAIDVNYDNYKTLARPWDGFECFEEFLEITADSDKIHYVKAGDELELCGLDMKVLNAYNAEITDKLSKDLANDGSMMFKIKNEKESMLFCADVGVKISDTIMQQFGNELQCDYIQMGHHGNGGLSQEFYQLTKAKIAFFDAPEWLMNPTDPETTWTTPQNRKLMENMGATVYYYNTAPNKVKLK